MSCKNCVEPSTIAVFIVFRRSCVVAPTTNAGIHSVTGCPQHTNIQPSLQTYLSLGTALNVLAMRRKRQIPFISTLEKLFLTRGVRLPRITEQALATVTSGLVVGTQDQLIPYVDVIDLSHVSYLPQQQNECM